MSDRSTSRLFAVRFSFGICLFLEALNLSGLILSPAVPAPAGSSSMIPGYHYAALPPDALKKARSAPQVPMKLEEATRLVFLSIRHADDRRITPAENWILWLCGKLYEPLSRTQDTDRLIAGGRALCGEKAQVLKSLTERAGLPTRFIGLNGHIVLEVQTEQGWQVADPDFGITYAADLARLESAEGSAIMRQELGKIGYGRETIATYIATVQSSADNIVFATGRPLSPRLYRIESLCDLLKWIVPLFFLIPAGYLLRDSFHRKQNQKSTFMHRHAGA